MILEGFKLRNVDKKTESFLSEIVRIQCIESHKISSVVVLVDELNAEVVSDNFSKQFNFENKRFLIFSNQKKENWTEGTVSKDDFGLLGKFKNYEIKEALNLESDLLINYVKNNSYLNNLVAQSKANFKVGFHDENEKLYDLMIDVKSDKIELFNNEIIKYLKILNKV